MSNEDILDRIQYVNIHILFRFFSSIWYTRWVFRALPEYTYKESLFIFWGLIVISDIFFIVLTLKKEHNNWNIFANIILPFGIYTSLAYINVFPKKIMWIIVLSSILTIIYCILLFFRRITNKSRKKKIIISRIRRAFWGFRNIASACLLILLIPLTLSVLFEGTILSSKVDSINIYGEQYSMRKNADIILNLREEVWQELTLQEKIDTMQVIANLEGGNLGISIDLNVAAGNLDENSLGYYNDRKRQVVMSLDALETSTAAEAVSTVCHESYHAYSLRLVDAYNELSTESKKLSVFWHLGRYAHEYSDYTDSKESELGYYLQSVEEDARAYGKYCVEKYNDWITDYLYYDE